MSSSEIFACLIIVVSLFVSYLFIAAAFSGPRNLAVKKYNLSDKVKEIFSIKEVRFVTAFFVCTTILSMFLTKFEINTTVTHKVEQDHHFQIELDIGGKYGSPLKIRNE